MTGLAIPIKLPIHVIHQRHDIGIVLRRIEKSQILADTQLGFEHCHVAHEGDRLFPLLHLENLISVQLMPINEQTLTIRQETLTDCEAVGCHNLHRYTGHRVRQV